MKKMFKRKFSPISFLIIVCLLGLIFLFASYIRPVVMSLANSKLKYIATKITNQSVSKEFSKEGINYEDLVIISKDKNDRVSSISINFPVVNKIKSDLTVEILDKIAAINETKITVPLGNFFNNEFMSGVGPSIPFNIVPNSMVEISFRDSFSGMSINQTLHEIYLDINVDICAVMPTIKTSNKVKTSFMVAHTVIVGEVPQSYTGINEIPGKVEDYILNIIP